ncbi:MAG: translation initiation factor IF-2 [Bacteroidota bacterium]
MAKRLIKIAKELNVGVSTIVDFLNDNGFEIDNKPTAKVSDDMEDALTKEFQRSIAIKERADKMKIGRALNKQDENISDLQSTADVAVVAPPPPTPTTKAPAPILLAQSEPTVAPAEEQKEQIITTAKTTPILSKPKILGNIKLDEIGRKKSKSEEAANKAPKSSPTPTPPKSVVKEPEKKVVAETTIEKAPKKVEEEKIVEAAKQENPVESVKEEKAETTAIPRPDSQESRKEEPAVEEEKSPAASEDGKPKLIKADAPELRGLKIKGKIDIGKFSRKPKKKDTKKDGAGGSGRKKDESKPGAAGGNKTANTGERKRRRKRKKVVTEGNNQRSNTGQRSSDSQGRGDNRSRDNRGGRGRNNRNQRGGNRSDQPKEVSQKEIEDSIKATMARLSGRGKKKRQKLRRENRERLREKQELIDQEQETEVVQLTEFVSVSELASLLDIAVTDVIMSCMNMGVIVSINQRLDAEIIELIAEEYEREIEFISAEEQSDEEEEIIDDPADLRPRAPIVTVMGHVDHGKTSLLDYIREASVAAGEAGGITQHIGAYEVAVGDENKKITFLDTPGHEAFTAMRARGAKVTDIAIIIIAADDDIMPQTKEAISHSQAAGVPMIFAINKVDKDAANPEKIKEKLAAMNLLVEDWGGTYQSQDISAKTGLGIEELLEKVILEAELLELQANPDRMAIGAILEASLDKGRGYVTKTLIQTGTLHVGDAIVAGEYSGKVKAMFNEHGKRVKEAGPSKPVLVLGLDGAPQAGERFKETENESEARQIASKRSQINREQANRATKRISLDEIGRRLALGTFKELNLIVKGDFDGSIEALSDSLIKQSIETVQVNVIHKAVGQIIESDVLLASASDAIIVGFQVRPSLGARKLAEKEGVQIRTYSIIYEAINEVRSAIEGMLEPTKEEKVVCNIEVREVYKISKVGTIAGCYVQEGKVTRNTKVRVVRDGIVVYPTKENVVGELASLKRFKDDAKEVKAGLECGMNIKNFNDIKVGDIIEGYEIVEVKQTLADVR